jgi:hypothetical protein
MIAFDMGLESGDQLGHITNGSECALKWSVAAERAMKLIRPGEVHFKLHHYRAPRMPLRKEALPLLADADRIPSIGEALAES